MGFLKDIIFSEVEDFVWEKAKDTTNPALEKRMQAKEQRRSARSDFPVCLVMKYDQEGDFEVYNQDGTFAYKAARKIGKTVIFGQNGDKVGILKKKESFIHSPQIGRIRKGHYTVYKNGNKIGKINYDDILGKKQKMSIAYNEWTVNGKPGNSYIVKEGKCTIAEMKRYSRLGENIVYIRIVNKKFEQDCVFLSIALEMIYLPVFELSSSYN